MHSKGLKLLLIFGALALFVAGKWLAQHLREKQHKTEWYQIALEDNRRAFKPGTTRSEVEQHFRVHRTEVKHMCCVLKTETPSATYDDLVKIGQESDPWFCREHNVYIAFEFNPKSQGEAPNTNDSDFLKRVSLFHEIEGCLR